ncbi:formate dehydrogenase accessory sulfurtransferase FdhD [Aeromicrobium sp. CF4.19]|uniref:formate dehydrogenase accessory sulfurtransferase FdhD n=1 Tax=Aeromicrobium sp. CF4.19 TaxID=3373082 RepID=UPI003EE76209
MTKAVQRRRLTRVDIVEGSRPRHDSLATEEPLEIRLGGKAFAVTMRTPGDDFDLVAGFCVSEGIAAGPDDLQAMRYCAGEQENTYNIIDVAVPPAGAVVAAVRERHVYTSSSCGVCGLASIDAVATTSRFEVATDDVRVDINVLAALPDGLREQQRVFESTGGVHAAGLFAADGTALCVREDVGRHNAVDKVVGWAWRENRLPLPGTVLQVSGRASFELVQKAAMAGIPVLAAVSAPSSLAVDLAERSGITLVGFSRGSSFNVYAHGERLT